MAELVYAGGAIDYLKETYHQTDGWQHRLQELVPTVAVYCPKCANIGQPSADAIIERNMRMLLEVCGRAVFVFDPGVFSMGTPIEAWQWASRRGARDMCLVHPAAFGIFVQSWLGQGAAVVGTLEEAAGWLRQPAR